MNEGKRIEIREIELKVLADLCRAIFGYVRGGDFRPMPQGDLLWLISEVLGLGRFNGRFSFLAGWRKTCWSHGLDPVSGELVNEADFETAVRELVVQNEHRHQKKEARKAKHKSQESSSESNGESSSEVEVLTPLTTGQPQEVAPMLRAIRNRLGPAKAPLQPLAPNYQPPPGDKVSEKFSPPKPNSSEPDWFRQRYSWAQRH
jgi:hypothetical protein